MDRLPPDPLPPWLSSMLLKLPPLGKDGTCGECGFDYVTGEQPGADSSHELLSAELAVRELDWDGDEMKGTGRVVLADSRKAAKA